MKTITEQIRDRVAGASTDNLAPDLRKEDTWSPEQGNNLIRILPPKSLRADQEYPWLRLQRHWEFGMCPKSGSDNPYDVPCVVCQAHQDGKASGATPEELEGIRPQGLFPMQVLVFARNENKQPVAKFVSSKPKVFKMTAMIWKQVEAVWSVWGPPWGEAKETRFGTSQPVAWDLMITRTGTGRATRYQSQAFTQAVKVLTPPAALKELKDLTKLFPIPSSAEIAKRFRAKHSVPSEIGSGDADFDLPLDGTVEFSGAAEPQAQPKRPRGRPPKVREPEDMPVEDEPLTASDEEQFSEVQAIFADEDGSEDAAGDDVDADAELSPDDSGPLDDDDDIVEEPRPARSLAKPAAANNSGKGAAALQERRKAMAAQMSQAAARRR